MSSYLEEVKGKNIIDIKDNSQFQDDLIRFMSSSRKDWSFDELAEKDIDWMVDEYVEHMRSQDSNEATALQDLYFARDDSAQESEKAAFGRLMMAWDNSEGVRWLGFPLRCFSRLYGATRFYRRAGDYCR